MFTGLGMCCTGVAQRTSDHDNRYASTRYDLDYVDRVDGLDRDVSDV